MHEDRSTSFFKKILHILYFAPETTVSVFKGAEVASLQRKMRWKGVDGALHSLHLICNDGSKKDNQKLLRFFHHLVLHTKSHVGRCQLLTSQFNSPCPFLTHYKRADDVQLKA